MLKNSLVKILILTLTFLFGVSAPARADESVADQILTIQGEIDRLNQQVATDQMQTFNIMRNLEQNSERQQERNAQAQSESDPQRKQVILDQINSWNAWAGDAQMELNGYNTKIVAAQTRIASLQKQVEALQALSVAEVVRATEQTALGNTNNTGNNNAPVNQLNPISTLEQQNATVQGQIDIDQNKTQQQIFDLNAVNLALQALKPGSQMWGVLTNTKKSLEDALNKTVENIAKNKEIFEAQSKIIDNLKSLNSSTQNLDTTDVKETLNEVSDISNGLAEKIAQNSQQITSINANLNEIDETLAKLDKNDPVYNQLTASRNLLSVTLKDFQTSSEKLLTLQTAQLEISNEVKEQTVLTRTAAVLTGLASDKTENSATPSISFQKNKSGKYTTKIDISASDNTNLGVDANEIKGLSVILKSSKGTFRVNLSSGAGNNIVLTLPKKIASGKYQLSLFMPGKKPVALPTKVQVK